VCSVLEAWEKTRSQRKRNGWLPNPARLAKLESRDLPGLGKKGEKEIRIYLEQHGLTFREDLDALSRKEQHLIKLIENCKKALEETQQRIRNCKGNDGA
jgi:superfamily I DNA/RNA helicase